MSFFRRVLNFIEELFGGDLEREPRKPVEPLPDVKTFSLQYNGPIVYRDRDYCFYDLFNYTKDEIEKANKGGAKTIAYFSLHYENFRKDMQDINPDWLERPLGTWRGEWVFKENKLAKIVPIMKKRIDLAKEKGFAGIDPDNLDQTSKASAIYYFEEIADYARSKGMLIGQKNCAEWVGSLEPDFYMTESAYKWNEIEAYLAGSKPVFNIEYRKKDFYRALEDPRVFTIMKDKYAMGGEEL